MIKLNYDNRVIFKPWGEEYNIFRNKKRLPSHILKLKKDFLLLYIAILKKKLDF